LADALSAASLAVLMRADGSQIVPEELLRRMESPWLRAVSVAGGQ